MITLLLVPLLGCLYVIVSSLPSGTEVGRGKLHLPVTPSLNVATSCDGDDFGRGLNISSCQEAVDRLRPEEDDPVTTWGPRGSGPWTYQLPIRYLSCMYGLFAVIMFNTRHTSGHLSVVK